MHHVSFSILRAFLQRLAGEAIRHVAGVVIALLLPGSVSWASDGIEPIATGTRARARAGADVAVGDSALSQIDNPATLTLSPRFRVDSDAELGILSTRWRGVVDAASSQRRLFPLLNSAAAFPVNERLSLGAAVHSKAGFGTQFNSRHLLLPLERRVGSDLKVISVPVSLAYKLSDRLSAGFGLRGEMATAKFSTVLGPADVEFGRGYAYGGGFQLGLHWQARDDLAFGLGYRSPTWMTDLAGGRGKASVLGLLPVPLGEVAVDELRLPQKITAGLAWDATSRLKLVSEVRWINYAASSLNALTIAGNGLADIRYPFPLGYRDQWAFIQAAQIKLNHHWNLAFGYHYATPAIPASHLAPIGSVIPQHHATVGLWYETERWWVGGGYVVAFPASLQGPGYSRIPLAVDYGLSDLRQSQHGIWMGFGLRW